VAGRPNRRARKLGWYKDLNRPEAPPPRPPIPKPTPAIIAAAIEHAQQVAAGDKPPPMLGSKYDAASLRANFINYAALCLKITDKEGRLIPLKLNHTQRVLFNKITELRAQGIPPRIVCLKSRQVGISTLAEALAFHDCHLNENRNALVFAHNIRTSRAIFRMTKRYLDNLPEPMQEKRRLENVNEIHFDHNDSRLQVEVAGESSRGHTAQIVHLAELGFMQYDHDTLRAVMQTVSHSINTLVIVESTANGVGNCLHSLWLKAMKRLADRKMEQEISYASGFVPVFVPWYRHEEYQIEPDFTVTTSDEKILMLRFNLTLPQIAWRR